MSAAALALAAAVVAVGAAIQGAVGFGLALVTAPVLILIDPVLVPGPLIGAALVLVVAMAIREHAHIDWDGFVWAFAGRLVGTGAGAMALRLLPPREMAITFGALVLLGVAMSVSGVRLRPTRGSLVIAGLLSGFMGTTTAIGGPPLALVYQNSSGAELRGTLSAHFVTGGILSLAALAAVGRYGVHELALTGALLPGIGAGLLASRWLVGHLDRGHTRTAVLVASTVGAVVVIVRALV